MSITKKLKKILPLLFLGTLFPVLAIPEGEGEGKGEGENPGDSGEESNVGDNNAGDNGEGEQSKNENDKTYSKSDIESIIKRRLARERKNFEKEFNSKLEREKLSEVDKAKAEKADAEKKADEVIIKANKRLIRSEVIAQSTKLGIIDSDAAYALIIKDDIEVLESGEVIGVETALKELISKKSYLVKQNQSQSNNSNQHQQTGDDQGSGGQTKKKFDMNSMIRKAAGR